MAKNTMTAREELLAVEVPTTTRVRLDGVQFKLDGSAGGFNSADVAKLIERQKDAVKATVTALDGESDLGKKAVSEQREYAGKALLAKLAAFVVKAATEGKGDAPEVKPVMKPTIAANKPVA